MGQDKDGDQVVTVKNLGNVTVGENMAQVGGTNVDTNSGTKSAGTQRIVIATDQPQLTNAIKVDLSATTANATAVKVDGSAVTQPVSIAGTVTVTEGGFSFTNLAANATTTIKSGSGFLHTLVINTKGITNTCTIYDNTAASGTKIATIDTTLSTTAFVYDVAFTTGLTVIVAGGTAADLTVSWR